MDTELQEAVAATPALQIREEAGTPRAECPLQTQQVSMPLAVLTPEATWSEFFWGLSVRSPDIGSIRISQTYLLQSLVAPLTPSLLSRVLYLEHLVLCHPPTTQPIHQCFLKAS